MRIATIIPDVAVMAATTLTAARRLHRSATIPDKTGRWRSRRPVRVGSRQARELPDGVGDVAESGEQGGKTSANGAAQPWPNL